MPRGFSFLAIGTNIKYNGAHRKLLVQVGSRQIGFDQRGYRSFHTIPTSISLFLCQFIWDEGERLMVFLYTLPPKHTGTRGPARSICLTKIGLVAPCSASRTYRRLNRYCIIRTCRKCEQLLYRFAIRVIQLSEKHSFYI
jgi:hypothetical protein